MPGREDVVAKEEAGIQECVERRKRANLPVPEDVLAIDCEKECPLHEECGASGGERIAELEKHRPSLKRLLGRLEPWALWADTDPPGEYLLVHKGLVLRRFPGTFAGARAALKQYQTKLKKWFREQTAPSSEEKDADPDEERLEYQMALERDEDRMVAFDELKRRAEAAIEEARREILPCPRLGRIGDPNVRYLDNVRGPCWEVNPEMGRRVGSRVRAEESLGQAADALDGAIELARAEFEQVTKCLSCIWFWRCAFYSGRLVSLPGEEA